MNPLLALAGCSPLPFSVSLTTRDSSADTFALEVAPLFSPCVLQQ